METKIAKRGSIITNYKSRKKIQQGEITLKRIYGLDRSRIKLVIQEISNMGINVLNELEARGNHLGDVAMDIVIDKGCKVWLLEVQVNYTVESKAKRREDERRILPQILPTPFEYAKTLSGFPF